MKKSVKSSPLKITRRAADGRILTPTELKTMAVTTPAVENAVLKAALRQTEAESFRG